MRSLLDAGQVDAYAVELAKAQAWARRQGYGFVDLNRVRPDPVAQALLPADLARRHGVLPLHRVGNTLWAVFRDPRDKVARAWAEETSRCGIMPVLAAPAKLEEALTRL